MNFSVQYNRSGKIDGSKFLHCVGCTHKLMCAVQYIVLLSWCLCWKIVDLFWFRSRKGLVYFKILPWDVYKIFFLENHLLICMISCLGIKLATVIFHACRKGDCMPVGLFWRRFVELVTINLQVHFIDLTWLKLLWDSALKIILLIFQLF